MEQIIERVYQQAVRNGLDAPSHPENNPEDWLTRRDMLDRRGTKAFKALLSPEEAEIFDRAFLGVMGIDTGNNDGGWHRIVTSDGTVVFPSEGQEK